MSTIAPNRHSPLTQNYDRFLIGGKLRDCDIRRYAKLGYYGTKLQAELNTPQPKRKQTKALLTARAIDTLLALYDL